MSYNVKLPRYNENGYYEIRLESIGGLGANLCGKMLGELGAVYLDLNSASFSSYGSEKRGSPVKAFIRWTDSDKNIEVNSPVENPDILGIFHMAMAEKTNLISGIDENSKIVVNTELSPLEVRDRLKVYSGEIFCIDALKIAMDFKTRINMVMLGAIAKASEFIPLEAVIELAENTIGKKYKNMVESNIEGLKQGYSQTKSQYFKDDGKYRREEYKEPENKWGYKNAPIGGVNTIYGSTVSNDLSASRQGYIPLFIQDKCINCGLCDTTCPDMVFQFKRGEYKGKSAMVNCGLDYHHCKGCLRCVDVCPTNALVKGVEREHPELKRFVRNKDLRNVKFEFENVGANSWITSDAYLDEKRIDGGIV